MTRPIVVGYDGSPASREAIRWAATEAERRDTALRIVHVPSPRLLPAPQPIPPSRLAPPSPPSSLVRETDGDALMRRLQLVHAEAERLLVEACDEIRPDHPALRIQVMAVLGDVVPVLVREAADAELLVIGSSGSTSSQLTADAPCPLVVVPARPPVTGARPTVTAVGAEGPW
jgi:nucleotide-binding universal stress UspA family protein